MADNTLSKDNDIADLDVSGDDFTKKTSLPDVSSISEANSVDSNSSSLLGTLANIVFAPLTSPLTVIEKLGGTAKWLKQKIVLLKNICTETIKYTAMAGAAYVAVLIGKKTYDDHSKYNESTIHDAISDGDREKLIKCLKTEAIADRCGVNQEKDGLMPLEIAAIEVKVDCVKLLIGQTKKEGGIIGALTSFGKQTNEAVKNLTPDELAKKASFYSMHYLSNLFLTNRIFDTTPFGGFDIRDNSLHLIIKDWMKQSDDNNESKLKILNVILKGKKTNLNSQNEGKTAFELVCEYLNDDSEPSQKLALELAKKFLKEKNLEISKQAEKYLCKKLNQMSLDNDLKDSTYELIELIKGLKVENDQLFLDAKIGNETLLINTAKGDQSDIVEKLLLAGANPDIQDGEGKTALFYAKGGKIIDLLLNPKTNLLGQNKYQKSDPNIRDNEGKTPLFDAVKANKPNIVKKLLLAGSDPEIQDNQGQNALYQLKDIIVENENNASSDDAINAKAIIKLFIAPETSQFGLQKWKALSFGQGDIEKLFEHLNIDLNSDAITLADKKEISEINKDNSVFIKIYLYGLISSSTMLQQNPYYNNNLVEIRNAIVTNPIISLKQASNALKAGITKKQYDEIKQNPINTLSNLLKISAHLTLNPCKVLNTNNAFYVVKSVMPQYAELLKNTNIINLGYAGKSKPNNKSNTPLEKQKNEKLEDKKKPLLLKSSAEANSDNPEGSTKTKPIARIDLKEKAFQLLEILSIKENDIILQDGKLVNRLEEDLNAKKLDYKKLEEKQNEILLKLNSEEKHTIVFNQRQLSKLEEKELMKRLYNNDKLMKENLLDQEKLLEQMSKQNVSTQESDKTSLDNCIQELVKTEDNSNGAINRPTIFSQINIGEKFKSIFKSSEKNTVINEIFSNDKSKPNDLTKLPYDTLLGSFPNNTQPKELDLDYAPLLGVDHPDNMLLKGE